MTSFKGHPFALPADVKLNANEEIVLESLLVSASGQGYDFGYADFDEATQEATDAMAKGAKSYRAYLGSLSKKGLIEVLETETNDAGTRYTQLYITMPSVPTDDEVDEAIDEQLAQSGQTRDGDAIVDKVWTVEELMDFKVFYSKRKLVYIVNLTNDDSAYLKGNKADFYAYLEDLANPKLELPNVIVEDDRILVG